METNVIGFRDTFLIGGPRHGHIVPLAIGNRSYVDIRSGVTYMLQTFARPVIGPLGVRNGIKAHDVLVMAGMLGGSTEAEARARAHQVQTLIAEVIVDRWFTNEGYDFPMPASNGHDAVGRVTVQPRDSSAALPPGGIALPDDLKPPS